MNVIEARTPEEMEEYWALRALGTASRFQVEVDLLELGKRPTVDFIWERFLPDWGLRDA